MRGCERSEARTECKQLPLSSGSTLAVVEDTVMKDEFPSPYPVWPTMGFDEWLARQTFEYAAKLHEAAHEACQDGWNGYFKAEYGE